VGLEQHNDYVYYYRSRRDGEKVRKVYVGAGDFAHVAAELDETERLRRKEEVAYWEAERERLERSAAFLQELTEAAELLTRAHLLGPVLPQHIGVHLPKAATCSA
jgi:hypothetical protein